MSINKYLLTLACPDKRGIVAAVTTNIFQAGGNVLEAHQFSDVETASFFMRIAFTLEEQQSSAFAASFNDLAGAYLMDWQIKPSVEPRKVLILVSKFDHCLVDLLYRRRTEEIPMDVVGIVSNHPRATHSEVDLSSIPFHYLPVTPETKLLQEAEIKNIVNSSGAELVILARYMQILSDDLASFLSGRCINIHHSFLPAFKGALPYHQAHKRGVKLIGATAHYVTAALDEGPIIEQDVERVSHQDSPESLVKKGRDIERRVLARAITWHLDGRVFPNRGKAVVFHD